MKALDAKYFPYAQISDGVLEPGEPNPALFGKLGLGQRKMPGEGTLPLRELLAALPKDVPLSVELPHSLAPAGTSARDWAKMTLQACAAISGNSHAQISSARSRDFCVLACGAAHAADWPTRPVRLVVGFAPGGPTDILARHMAQYLTTKLGQQFVVENKPGATGNIATEYVMGQPADGYTILVTTTANAINMTFLQKLTTNFMRDMEPVAGLASFTYMMLVNPGVPAKSVPEFIAYAKANPGKINFASGGVGSSNQLAVELFKSMTGTELVHVPYRGNAAAYPDLISGNIQLIFADIASGRPHAQSGALRALGVTAAKRLATLPDVPAIAETVPGYEADGWYGFAAPKGTPADVIAKLNAAINAGLADAELAARFAQLEARPLAFTPQEYRAFLVSEVERWGKAVKAAGVRGD